MTVKSELDRLRLSYIAFKYDTGTSTFQGYTGTVWKIIDTVRYNTGTSQFEGWNGTSWVALGGSGGGASLLDPNFDETFIYYTRSDFEIDADLFFGSTTGTDNIVSAGNIVLDKTQNFISSNLLGPVYLSDAPILNTAQVRLLYNVGKVDNNYTFTVTAANATAGAVYSNNLTNFTVLTTISGGTTLLCSGVKEAAASGTLTKVSGTGDATITFSAVSSLAIELSADGGSNWITANAYSRVNSGQFIIADFTFAAGTTSTDFRLKVTSGTDDSELAGFGVNMVQDSTGAYAGDATFETRVITATEASTGLVTLTGVRFTPGAHQLHCNYNGHDFMAPDFIELGGGQVQFPLAFFTTGDVAKFYVSYGLVKEGDAAITINNVISANTTMGSLQIPTGFTLDKPYMEIPAGATVSGAGNVSTDKAITGAGILATTGTVLSRGVAPTQPKFDRIEEATSTKGVAIRGRSDGGSPGPGDVGQELEQITATSINTAGIGFVAASKVITAGTWIISASLRATMKTSFTVFEGNIGTSSSPGQEIRGQIGQHMGGCVNGEYRSIAFCSRVFNTTGTTVYLNCQTNGVNDVTVIGTLNCIRIA